MKALPLLILSAVAFAGDLPVRAAVSQQTLNNLNTAYQGESNAANRYAKFAEKADAEGYAAAASLFRAAAALEAIHRDNHKRAIEALGGKVASFQLDQVVVADTAANLRAAIKGESYERDTIYAEFLKQAKMDDAEAAIRSLNCAFETEAEHAKLYQATLDHLQKGGPAQDFYVCQVCGMTLPELPAKKCPVCRKSRDEYKKIS